MISFHLIVFVSVFFLILGGHNLTEKEGTSDLYGQRNHLVKCCSGLNLFTMISFHLIVFVSVFFLILGGHNLTEKEGTSDLYGQRNHLVLCRYLHDLVISCNSLNQILKKFFLLF